MAVDKLVDSTQLDSDLTSVANAIRTRGGTSADLAFPAGFVSAVGAIGNQYSAADEGKVVSNGQLVAQGSDTVTQNGTVDTTLINSLTVDVQGSGSVVESGSFTPASNSQQHTINLNSNTYQLVAYWLSPDSPTALNHSLRVEYCKGFRLNAGVLKKLWNVYSNAGGTSWTGVSTTGSDSSTFANGVLTIKGNYLIAGCTYNWIAVP